MRNQGATVALVEYRRERIKLNKRCKHYQQLIIDLVGKSMDRQTDRHAVEKLVDKQTDMQADIWTYRQRQ